MKNVSIVLLTALFCSCSQPTSQNEQLENAAEPVKKQRPVSLENGKFFEVNNRKMLYGGQDSVQHFDITGYELKDSQFHYGIGRERFPALLEPEFISAASADTIWADSTRFLVAYSGDEVKAYSVKDLTRHEVVNDVIDGHPIMAAYCILADLGAIYDRQYGDQVLTFGVSGYTYYDPKVWNGLDGFILWDRDTESLWWPLIDRAVSGPLKGVGLKKFDEAKWVDITWGEVKSKYANAQVLVSGQDYERPETWDRLESVTSIVENFSQLKE